MTSTPGHAPQRPRAVLIGIAVLVLASAITAAAFAAQATIVGKTGQTPNPSCPGPDVPNPPSYKSCNVMGQVTGFQRSVDGKKSLFKAKKNGKIVAWSIDLSKPRENQRDIFEEFGGSDRYGDGPTAGIAVLKKLGDRKFKLKKKSPIVKVKGYLGQKPTFTLEDPLKVKKGEIIAVTTATWLPNFALQHPGANRALSDNNVWVASRQPDECSAGTPEEFFNLSSPHLKQGSDRTYGCVYSRARLLYWAHFVPNG